MTFALDHAEIVLATVYAIVEDNLLDDVTTAAERASGTLRCHARSSGFSISAISLIATGKRNVG